MSVAVFTIHNFLFVFHFVHFSELVSCNPVTVDNASTSSGHKSKRVQHYIELYLNLHDVVKRPRVRCINEEMALRASRHVSIGKLRGGAYNLSISLCLYFQINYAKSVYHEREHTLNYETVIDC